MSTEYIHKVETRLGDYDRATRPTSTSTGTFLYHCAFDILFICD